MSRKNKVERKYVRFLHSKQIIDYETATRNKEEYPILEQYEGEEEIIFLYIYGNGWTILEVTTHRENETLFLVPHDWADNYLSSLELAEKELFQYVMEAHPGNLF